MLPEWAVFLLQDRGMPAWIGIAAQIAVVVALGIAAYQAHLLRRQLEISAQNRRAELAFRFIERWNEPSFVEMRIPVVAFLRKSKGFEELRAKIESDAVFSASFTLVLNFLEELGIAWNRNNLDRDLCINFFGTMTDAYYTTFSDYIEHRRAQLSPRVWAQFTAMVQDIQKEIRRAQAK